MTVRKRFDPALYAENDLLAKNAVKAIVKGTEYQIIDNQKLRNVDLFLYKDSIHIANIETEIKKRVWTTGNFEYKNVQLPFRKKKYCELDKPTLFIIWNIDQTAYLAFWDKDALASPVVEVPNKYNYKGEMFFQIPIEKCIQTNLLDVIKELK